MPASAKKYVLRAAPAGSNERPVCAFFLSADGCRNGDKCKFLHTTASTNKGGGRGNGGDIQQRQTPQEISDTASMISSESESGGGVRSTPVVKKKERKQKQIAIKQEGTGDDDIFTQNPPTPKVESTSDNSNSNNKKKSKKKNRRSEENDIFAGPKTKANKSSTTAATTQSEGEGEQQPPKKKRKKGKNSQNEQEGSNKHVKEEPQATDFRSLVSNMPIAAFHIPGSSPEKPKTENKKESTSPPPAPPVATSTKENPALPPNTEAGRKWKKAVLKSQKHDRFLTSFDFDRIKEQEQSNNINTAKWIRAKPYGSWCQNNPTAIAIDCEMCETQDPKTKSKNPKALCRISVVNAENPEEVLLDTLVKPEWPVSDYRTRINGVTEESLKDVVFTMKHAQTFMSALCSENTVIVGQAVHNDLAAIRMEHYCVADSATLFEAKDSPGSSVSLKDLVKSIFNIDMPNTHDSVNDARKALECVKYWMLKDGKVDPIERSTPHTYAKQLFIHRIPKVCKPDNLMSMFLKHTSVEPSEVDDIEFAGQFGKTHVTFRSGKHATLAFDTLESKAEEDASGRLQKKVYLRDGSYIRVRKMAYPRRKSVDGASNINNETPRK